MNLNKNLIQEIVKRDRSICQRCSTRLRYKKNIVIRHIVSAANEGTDDTDNLIVLCKECDKYAEANKLSSFSEITNSDREIAGLNDGKYKPWYAWVYGGARNPKT